MAAWTGCFESLSGSSGSVSDAAKDTATIRCLEPLFRNILQTIVALMGVGLFIMLLIGGFSFLFSGGDAKKLQQAKATLGAAILGIVLMVSAYLILKIIESFTGLSLSTFRIEIIGSP